MKELPHLVAMISAGSKIAGNVTLIRTKWAYGINVVGANKRGIRKTTKSS